MKIPRQAMQGATITDIGGLRAGILTHNTLNSTVQYVPPLETIHFAPGDGNAEKITGITSFNFAPVCDFHGVKLGSVDDTSLTWTVGTCLTEEVPFYPLARLEDDEFLAKLTKGQYAIDYALGKLFYCKANDTDNEVCSYTTRQQSLQVRTLCENQTSWEVNLVTILAFGTGQMLPNLTIPNGMELVIRAHPDNAGNVYLSHTKVGAQTGVPGRVQLGAGQAQILRVVNANLVWWDASQADQQIEIFVEVAA